MAIVNNLIDIVENLINKFFTSGGLAGLVLLLVIILVFYIIFVLNRIALAFLIAIKTSLYSNDHELKAVKKVAHKYCMLPDRRNKGRGN